ncbi:TetR family transcriptional regulator [Sphingobium sp. 22B]|uniref:TetR/AcrR family transcriptional regulator n=1 Tax=unclassified Sphingobium TaxID=2611147 RepID=UPI0007834984|nr:MULTISPECIES: TetR/AcrR family transcriptional regulator [unclassified Sphingobium]KXU32686.1 TetR family transcriptional regulator [Sphingobium sp. AM]KYC32763.1 TetR family transcriptional regulator [Sphingobium sp. 22B]OAP31653.1 TetR family transcriptional regulator [Sphingobium sp. 20006FA]
MGRKVLQKQKSHARILDEAAAVMRQQGCQGISVADLMQRAGLTHGGFYNHFRTRDDLVAETVDRMFRDSLGLREKCLSRRDIAKGLSLLIDVYLSEGTKDAPQRGCPLPALASEAPRMPADARTRFSAGIENFLREMTRAFEALGRPQPARLAASVLGEMVGAMSLARAVADEEAGKEILRSSRQLLKDRLDLD